MSESEYLNSRSARIFDDVEKGFLSPAVGAMKQPVRGGFMTTRFPKKTASGRRQLANQKAEKISDAADEVASNARFAQESVRSNRADNVRRNANMANEKASRSAAALRANQKQRLPADMQGVTNRAYY